MGGRRSAEKRGVHGESGKDTEVVSFRRPAGSTEIEKVADALNPEIQHSPDKMIRIVVEASMVKAARTEGAGGRIVQGKTEVGKGKQQIYVAPDTLGKLLNRLKPANQISDEELIQIGQSLVKGEKPETTVVFDRTVDELKEILEK